MSFLAQVTYTQSVQGNKNFTVPFEYLNQLNIFVKVNGVTTSFTFLNDNTVVIDPAPAVGAEVFIQRLTNKQTLAVQFTDASTLTASALNVGNRQSLFVVQEAGDLSEIAEQIATDANATADAADTKADAAVITANAADGKADTAIIDSAAAVITANAADGKADTAISDSSAAVITADAADGKADAAVITANDAETKIDAAVITANDADTKADAAVITANDAFDVASGLSDVESGDILLGADNLSKVADVGVARTTLGLGTAAVADVTTSPTDTTAGRLLKIGDFGFGGTALEQNGPTFTTYVGGLDDVRRNGLYGAVIASGGGNESLSGVVLHTDRYDDGLGVVRAQQMYFGGGSIPLHQQVRVRNLVDSTWGLWRKVYEQNSILGTVSQTAGVPTGAIIERDSNNNGEYVKFADGTMICTRSVNLTPLISGTPLGFAADFALPPVVSLGAVGDISSVQQRQTLRDTVIRSYTNAWQIYLEKSESYTEVVINYGLSAIGRWY